MPLPPSVKESGELTENESDFILNTTLKEKHRRDAVVLGFIDSLFLYKDSAQIFFDAELKDLKNAFQGNNKLILLMAHGHETENGQQTVEFADGFRSLLDMKAIIPKQFSGIIDLSVCNPEGLEQTFKERARQCRVAISDQELDTEYWMRYILAFLYCLKTGGPNIWFEVDECATRIVDFSQ